MKFTLNKKELLAIAKENNYSATNIEKVLRLCSVLADLNTNSITSGKLVLKGGTAINLVTFNNIPRLSVDLDFNFAYNISKDEMIVQRKIINQYIEEKFRKDDYELSFRNSFTLDSISLKYKTLTGSQDKIKLDINYQNRCHIFDTVTKTISIPFLNNGVSFDVKTLNEIELFAGKIKAFYERCKPRDIYDIYTIAKSNSIKCDADKELLRKCVYFYGCIGNDTKKSIFSNDLNRILELPFQDIKTQLLPMLHVNSGKYPKEEINNTVISFLTEIMVPDGKDIEFWNKFMQGMYEPELIFDELTANKLKTHPVALYTLRSLSIDKKDSVLTDARIYSSLNGLYHFVKCKIDDKQQSGIIITDKDYNLYVNKGITKEELARKYFKNEIDNLIDLNNIKGIKP